MSHHNILAIIDRIRNSFPDAIHVYTHGSCIKFSMILLEIFPDGKILYDNDHSIFEFDGKYYDITGEVSKGKHIPIEEYGVMKMYDLMNLTYKGNLK